MSLNRPSTDLHNKTDVNPSLNRPSEATAADFAEICNLLSEYASAIETLQGNQSPNPYYGRYSSLVLLETAYPTGDTNAWAIIDTGLGTTPQVANWNVTNQEWELGAAIETIVYVANDSARPSPGVSGKLYITIDQGNQYAWINNAYKLIGEGKFAKKTNVLEKDNTTPFTPTEDYHPAPKKFVLESINQNIDGGAPDSVYVSLQVVDGGAP